MSDKPRLPTTRPAPLNQPLAVYPSQSVRVEDLDAPYPANPVTPVVDADLGLGIRHIENHLSVSFEKWSDLSVGDVYEFYMGGQAQPLAWGEIRAGEETQDRYHLAISQELVPQGWVPDCFGRVLRAGSGNESTSPPADLADQEHPPWWSRPGPRPALSLRAAHSPACRPARAGRGAGRRPRGAGGRTHR
ncbi:hypothetical protein [Pseudomonas mucidolens]|uniref:hypothetical protein n=1 Tax=Pseudomonas mucidolens TaxID=46679 RepID=UPI0030DB3F79